MISKYIKVSQYAKIMGLHPLTINRHFHQGLIDGYQDEKTKTIYLINPEWKERQNKSTQTSNRVILYARVSSASNQKSLDGQIDRMRNYAAAKGYQIVDEVKEIASGINDQRPKFTKILKRHDYDILLSEHRDRLTRFGFNYIRTLLNNQGIKVEVINEITDQKQEMMDDFISIVTSFCHQLYGRNQKKKLNQIIEDITNGQK